jgi:hypothetical protein
MLAVFCFANTAVELRAVETVWYDCKDIGIEGKGWTNTTSLYDRLPPKAEGKVTPTVWDLSHDSASLCVHFRTDAPSIQIRWDLLREKLGASNMPASGVSGVDLYAENENGSWQFIGNGLPTAHSNTSTFSVPTGEKNYVMYLPLYNGVESAAIGVPQGYAISAITPRSPRESIVFYGTSITQGGCASHPGLAFTSDVGRRLDRPVINLGFSGSAYMEPVMADLLAELDPAVYVLDCIWNMTPQMVADRVGPFVKRLRQAHPDTPILLAEDSSVQNICPTDKGVVLRSVLDQLKTEGVKNLYFLPSQGMLGSDGLGTVDGIHPNDIGMTRMADAFTGALRPIVSPEPSSSALCAAMAISLGLWTTRRRRKTTEESRKTVMPAFSEGLY